MRSELPASENEDRRIIPFPRLGHEELSAADMPAAWCPSPEHAARAEEERDVRPLRSEMAARHYLKFMLPSIPITMFVIGFVYCSLVVDSRSPVPATSPGGHDITQSPLPLIGALLLAVTSGMLCVMIYHGYLRASGEGIARQA